MADLDELPGDAVAMVLTAAWLAPDRIPIGLLSARENVRAMADTLCEAGLITMEPDGACSIASATQQLLRESFGGWGRVSAITTIAAYLGEPGSLGETARCLILLPHLTAWVTHTRPEDDTAEVADLLSRVVVLLLENEMGLAAVPLAERVARATSMRLQPDAPQTLVVNSNLAAVYRQAGRYRSAARLLELVIEAQARLRGPDHPSVWSCYHELGDIYLAAGDYGRSQEIVERIVAHHTKALGPSHRGTLTARNNLAVVLEWAGRRDEAAELWAVLLPQFEAALGPEDDDTVLVRTRLADAGGKHPGTPDGGADEESELPSARTAAALGELTQQAAAGLLRRAIALGDQGRWEEAGTVFLQLLEQGEASLGAGHPTMVVARSRMAMVHYALGRFDLALAAAEEALAAADRYLGRTHTETVTAAATVMRFLLEEKRFEELHPLLEERLADVIELLGFQHLLVRMLAVHRARIDLGLGQWP